MSDIQITDLTNVIEGAFGTGTGVFDKLMQTITLHIKNEFEEGRISGEDYTQVYLGSLKEVLAQSLQFVLNEQQAGKQAELIDSQIRESEEKIDLLAAQTAREYEVISASQANTTRENIINNKQVIKLQKESIIIERQTEKVSAEIQDQTYVTDFIRPQELIKITSEHVDQTYVTDFIRPEEVDLLQSRDAETLAATTRSDNESTQKILLMAAQTLGFRSDTKVKVLKQMHDGYAVNLSISGTGNVPEANQDAAIDDLVNNIMLEVGGIVVTAVESPE